MRIGAALDDTFVLTDDEVWFLKGFASRPEISHDAVVRGAKLPDVDEPNEGGIYPSTGAYLPLEPVATPQAPAPAPKPEPKRFALSPLVIAGLGVIVVGAAVYFYGRAA